MEEEKKLTRELTAFEKRVKPLLTYVGLIGAIICTIAYIVVIFVLIKGFEQHDILSTTIFAIVTAAVGFIVMQFLKVQGESFAKEIPENKVITDKYFGSKTKDKKNHSMRYYWITTVIKDILTKCLSIAATSIGVIYIVIEGSNDYNLLKLAVVNILMFVCFGILALVKTYDFYNTSYIAYLKEKIAEGEKNESSQS